ncbi:MAG: shikimate kinase [Nitrospirota bacterium]|nr:shikimate kinase [Nitrospirota bacterium]
MGINLSDFIILVGPRGSGKTTLGHALARAIDSPFYDTDRMVEEMTGESISQIWERGGEELFRDKESLVLQSMRGFSKGVVSTGGGIVLKSENRKLLSGLGPVFYLHVHVANLIGRLSSSFDKRPRLLKDLSLPEEVQRIVSERDPLYRSIATRVIEIESNSIAGTVEDIVSALKSLEPPIGEFPGDTKGK